MPVRHPNGTDPGGRHERKIGAGGILRRRRAKGGWTVEQLLDVNPDLTPEDIDRVEQDDEITAILAARYLLALGILEQMGPIR